MARDFHRKSAYIRTYVCRIFTIHMVCMVCTYSIYSMRQDVCTYVHTYVLMYDTHRMQQTVCTYVWYSQHGMTVVFATSATLLLC